MKKIISLTASLLFLFLLSSVSVIAYADNIALDYSNTIVSVDDKGVYYDGTLKTPPVNVDYNGITLAEGTDYTVEYSDNLVAGMAKITITGTGNYSGTIYKTFNIKRLNLSESGKTTVSFDVNSLVYYNQPVCPVAYVVYNNGTQTPLTEGIDYTIEYSNNTKIGRGKAVIKGIGNYSGKVTKYFKIIPQQVTGVSVSGVSTSSVTVKWTKLDGVTGYQILSYNPKTSKYTSIGTVSSKSNSYTISKLSPNQLYTYVVRAYKTVDDTNYYGAYSMPASDFVKPSALKVTAVTKEGSTLTVDWEKITCSGYEIYYSTDKKMKKNVKKVTASSKKTSCKIKGVDKSKTYYVKMRAYSTVNGKTRYGEKSAMVSSYFSNVYATYYSYYENNPNRTNNLRLASKAISGTIVQPGETFDFNAVVGPRTSARGYKDAHVFKDDKTVTNEIGGGICQVASTMFNCVLRANFGIVERHQHTQRVAYVPLGRDAAIYGTANNFRWKNTSKYAVQVQMEVKNGIITCTFYTCKKAKPKKVSLNVTQNGNSFTLKRVVDGKTNYTCHSKY